MLTASTRVSMAPTAASLPFGVLAWLLACWRGLEYSWRFASLRPLLMVQRGGLCVVNNTFSADVGHNWLTHDEEEN